MRICGSCDEPIGALMRADARYCSTRCRVAAHRRARQLPKVMTTRRAWVRADGKRPIQCDGSPASSTDPATWSTYRSVQDSDAGNGYGLMLGDGLGCWDLDYCFDGEDLTPEAAEVVASISDPVVWMERSVSGNGLHVFVECPEAPGSKSGKVEFYSRQRFIRVTGEAWHDPH